MEAESEPYVRLATLRTLHRVVADLNAARSLPGTLQAVVEGSVHGLGFDAAALSLVRPDGDLVVAAVWEYEERDYGGPSVLLGQVGTRESWDRLLAVSDHWGTLRFLPHDRGWAVGTDIPRWTGDGPLPVYANDWHPEDGLLAPMYSAGGELLGVLSVDRPRSGKRPGAWTREALEMFSCRPPSRSATPGYARRCSARWPAWRRSSRRCGPARRASGTPSSTPPAGWPSPNCTAARAVS